MVNATDVSDYRKTLVFVQQRNIRLAIRTTGRGYLGKSTGAGALALWTHNLKDRVILDYTSAAYAGKAFKLSAGIHASEAQETANRQGFVLIEGACPTVGIAGGCTQGGGAGPLASKFGLAADQVIDCYSKRKARDSFAVSK